MLQETLSGRGQVILRLKSWLHFGQVWPDWSKPKVKSKVKTKSAGNLQC